MVFFAALMMTVSQVDTTMDGILDVSCHEGAADAVNAALTAPAAGHVCFTSTSDLKLFQRNIAPAVAVHAAHLQFLMRTAPVLTTCSARCGRGLRRELSKCVAKASDVFHRSCSAHSARSEVRGASACVHRHSPSFLCEAHLYVWR